MRLMMLTGAGISTGAGLSTYRGIDGRHTEIENEAGMPIEALLSTATLKQDPGKLWRYWLLVCDAELDVPGHITPARVTADAALPILASLVAIGCDRESLARRLTDALAHP